MHSRLRLLLTTVAVLLPYQRAVAQHTSVWRGLSHCVSAEHPCRDEQVIYRVSATADSSQRVMSGARIAGTDTVDMGPLTLTHEASSGQWLARLPVGIWRFQIGRDSLTGTFAVNDGTIMRRVTAAPLR